jgi:cytosine/creatinine deaminase
VDTLYLIPSLRIRLAVRTGMEPVNPLSRALRVNRLLRLMAFVTGKDPEFMLVLSRTRGEAIMIGDETEVTVVDVRGDKVRLGISAPRTTKVHRKEIYEQIRDENRSSSRLTPSELLPTISAQGTNGVSVHPRMDGVKPEAAQLIAQEIGMDPFLRAAIEEARQGLKEGGLPIGSVLVRDGKIVAAGHNRRVQKGDPMAHAEIDCLSRAGRQKTYRDTVLYSTLMPCYLCSGAVVQFGIPKVIVGESVNFPGGPDFMKQHGANVVNLHDAECIEMMQTFIREHPDLWNEDIGK